MATRHRADSLGPDFRRGDRVGLFSHSSKRDVLYRDKSPLDFGDALLAKGLAPTSSLTILENARL